jgi:hypothetical protein
MSKNILPTLIAFLIAPCGAQSPASRRPQFTTVSTLLYVPNPPNAP